MRKAGVTLPKIREAREYLEHEFKSKFPFAEYRFNTDGKALFVTYDQITGSKQRDKLLCVTQSGQLAWKEILNQRLQEFEYDSNLGKVVRWKVGGADLIVVFPSIIESFESTAFRCGFNHYTINNGVTRIDNLERSVAVR